MSNESNESSEEEREAARLEECRAAWEKRNAQPGFSPNNHAPKKDEST